MNPFSEVAEYLNDTLLALPCLRGAQAFGIAEMVEKDGKRWPVENLNGKGCDIIPDNRYPVQLFWFKNSGAKIRPDDGGYGENEQLMTGTLSLICVGSLNAVNAACGSLQEDMEYKVIAGLPNTAFTVSGAVYGLTIEGAAITGEKIETLEKFWSGYEWGSRILDLFAFQIDIEIRGTVCMTCAA